MSYYQQRKRSQNLWWRNGGVMNMNKIHYKARKIKVLLSFAAIITSICIGSMFVSSSNQVKALVQSSQNSGNNNKLSFQSLVQQGSPFLGKLSAPITIIE